MRKIVEDLILKIEEAKKNPKVGSMLPQNAYYLNENEILCSERKVGVSRYPYDSDGLVLWAYSNGIIEACESTFNIFKPIHYCEEPSLNFFGGILKKDGNYIPVSLFDSAKQLLEEIRIDRYVVYCNKCVYYISDTEKVTFALRIHTDEQKHMHFSFNAYNKTDKSVSIYLFSMFEAILRYAENEIFWDRMNKFGNCYDNAYILRSCSNCLVINRKIIGGKISSEYHTTGRSDVTGNKRTVINSDCLISGRFARERNAVNTTELPVAADMVNVLLEANQSVRCEFDLSYCFSMEEALNTLNNEIDTDAIDTNLVLSINKEKSELDSMKIDFKDWKGSINAELLNKFLRTVQKQVSFCALGKNYAGSLIGVRDVMQQLESSLIWQPEKSREKIITALNYILEDGRPPRQFSVPSNSEIIPEMDLRKYIDQGVWIISTIYSYLSFTDDYSILDEICSYYVVDEKNTHVVRKSEISNSVLEHLLKIMNFLSNNIDCEYGTNCLRILHGDWNDALDGLGKSNDFNKEFGSGVSVMTTLQFYRNCKEMIEILEKIGKYKDKIEEYQLYRKRIEKGLLEYAVDFDNNGNRKIIHGWGDEFSYKIGSFSDPDAVSRISSTAHSFWALSGMLENDITFKDVIKNAFDVLTSDYGLLTFDKPFGVELQREVGRISGITAGTYENSASYVHAALFGIMALFSIGESEKAWNEMEKSCVISHKNCSMTPFVMPNSYCYNPEYGIDGESMGDWYTGSGTVLIKAIVKYGFGVSPNLDGLLLQTAQKMPCNNAELSIVIKGHPIKLIYTNKGGSSRSVLINGKSVDLTYNEIMKAQTVFIPALEIYDNMIIHITDT